MRVFIKIVLLSALIFSGVSADDYSARTRSGGAVGIIKAKIFLINGLSHVVDVLNEASAEVKKAQTAQELSDIILYTGKKFKDIMGLMKKTVKPYENIIENDKDFMEAGQTLAGQMMTAYTKFQDAVMKWREGKTLSPQDEALLLAAVKALSEFGDDE
ncbi:MAG: hypothetical protein HPY53_03435 [Brevinematales bacterium]|nr:hypothetical protein [Brevinematales bacterium]